ncbi:MAG TPA: SGNH/GDSL hydrolase family protein [Pseudomonadales bacterium]|nr:SGNH/GDSL hydrolase family protein [Pseudomonadales bacterium]
MNKRLIVVTMLFLSGIVIWLPGSQIIELIITNEEIVLGRYSRGHFGILLLLTLILWVAASVMFFTRRKPLSEVIFALLMVYLSTGVSAFALVVVSGFFNKPRYVEQEISGVDADTGVVLSGVVRHRPPQEQFKLLQKDVPEQLRSYPDAPAGYPEFSLVLTTDSNGFRNQQVLEKYDMVAVGDSFVAGSHVSDHQAWVDQLRQQTGQSIYNLGVSGSNPLVYLNNFITLGRKLQPKTVVVMLYEGNDFRDAPPLPKLTSTEKSTGAVKPVDKAASIGFLAKASPVTQGLRRLTGEVLAKIGRDNPVPGYAESVGFMPLAIDTPAGRQHYSFDPKRLRYLVEGSEQQFADSSDWKNVRDVLDQFVMLSKKDGFRLLFVYAPSAPHVVMPLAAEKIPAQQLLNFSRFKQKDLNLDAETYKQQVLARLDGEENVWKHWCNEVGAECVSTTSALREAAAAGHQVYYTYDQHWTPEGNNVTAKVLAKYLSTGNH